MIQLYFANKGLTSLTKDIVDTVLADRNKNDVSSIVLDAGITTIGECAFTDYINLSSIQRSKVTTYEKYSFQNCSLTGDFWIDYVDKIGEGAFKGNNFTKIKQSKTLTTFVSISDSAFENCQNLQSVQTYRCLFGKNTFKNCLNLSSITTIPTGNIPDGLFQNTSLNGRIWLDNYDNIGNYAFANTKISELQQSKSITKTINIGNYVFSNCTALTTIGNIAFNNIGDYAFAGCTNFPEKISLPNCTEIGRFAFQNCTNLSNLNAPKCTFVDYNAFQGTKLWDVDPV